MFNNTILLPEAKAWPEVMRDIATRVRMRRLELNLPQEEMAKRSGVKLPTYRKFEQTGLISLKGLLQIAFALDCLDDFEVLFSRRKYQNIEDVINERNAKKRQRAGRKG